ncbi:MAG: flagellar biosynthesis regulator FlaF [Hyphomonadaceae bacterium]
MSVKLYQKTATRTETPRQIEARAFATVTRGLIEADNLPTTEIGRRAEALSNNRRLWTIMASDCAVEGNPLPAALRAQIISLSLFVDRHSSAVLRHNESMDILIDINRSILEGLSSNPGNPGEPAPQAAAG